MTTIKESKTDEPQGPVSYFPSIEKKYGKPFSHWLELLKQLEGMKHIEMVAWLKSEHGMGHGHANALIGCWLKKEKLTDEKSLTAGSGLQQFTRG